MVDFTTIYGVQLLTLEQKTEILKRYRYAKGKNRKSIERSNQ